MFGRYLLTTETSLYRVTRAWNIGHKKQVVSDHRDRKKQFYLYRKEVLGPIGKFGVSEQ